MRTVLRSLWAWLSVVVIAVVGLPVVAVARLFDRDPARYRTGRTLRRVGATAGYAVPTWQMDITGTFPDDPRHPYVVVCNHQSNADPIIISRLPWEMKWVAKKALFRVPVIGWMFRMAGDIAVDRRDRESRAAVLTRAKEVLRARCSVMFFPEGTRSRDARVNRFADGAFRLAVESGLPLLPLALDGTRDALPRESWKFSGTSNIRLHVLAPLPTADLSQEDVPALRDQVRRQIIDQLAAWRGVEPETLDALAPPASTSESKSA